MGRRKRYLKPKACLVRMQKAIVESGTFVGISMMESAH
jgi:hypothetical protein